MLSLHYESHFISEVLTHIQKGENSSNGLIVRVLNKSLPHFVEVLKAFLGKSEKALVGRGDTISSQGKLNIFIHILDPVTVASVVFTNVVRVSGVAGGMDEMTIINNVSESLLAHLKFHPAISDFPKNIQTIWDDCGSDILMLSPLEKIDIGKALVDMCLDACEELFKKELVMISSKERVNIVTIKKEFLVSLSDLAFNPLKLPMIYKPGD